MSGDLGLAGAVFGADTSDFKNGINEINREIRVLQTDSRQAPPAWEIGARMSAGWS